MFLKPDNECLVGTLFFLMLWLGEGHGIHAVAKLVGEHDHDAFSGIEMLNFNGQFLKSSLVGYVAFS